MTNTFRQSYHHQALGTTLRTTTRTGALPRSLAPGTYGCPVQARFKDAGILRAQSTRWKAVSAGAPLPVCLSKVVTATPRTKAFPARLRGPLPWSRTKPESQKCGPEVWHLGSQRPQESTIAALPFAPRNPRLVPQAEFCHHQGRWISQHKWGH